MKSKRNNIHRPEMIALDVTYKCNLRCLHCFNFSGEDNTLGRSEMTDEELLEVAQDIIELMPQTVCLCGGEPILRGEIIYKVIEKINIGTNGNTKVNMVTNGQAITRDIARKLKDSGLYNVQVSLDGPDNESCDWIRNKIGAFDKAVSAIKCLILEGLYVSVACCPSKKNYTKIEKTMDLAKNLGVRMFRVQPLMNLGRAQEYLSDYMMSFIEYKKVVDLMNTYKMKYLDMDIEWGDPLHHLLLIALESDRYTPAVSISAYGDINISPYIPIYFGNIKKHSLCEYWENGLKYAERAPFYQEICKTITSYEKMDVSNILQGIPKNFKQKSIGLDLIDTPEYIDYTLAQLIEANN